jgi:hypothetical protein
MENGNIPATKADLADLGQALRPELTALEARLNERHDILRSEMAHGYHDLKESMRDMQTELLKVFLTSVSATVSVWSRSKGTKRP